MRQLVFAWIALVALAGLSFAASFVHLGRLGLPAAIAIALVKALVVTAVFMELASERGSIRFVAAAAIALLAVFVGLAAIDPATRDPAPIPASAPRD
ncbi:MAG: cytochrome C oxidase subunit IV family protein [Polyangiales bacterium]